MLSFNMSCVIMKSFIVLRVPSSWVSLLQCAVELSVARPNVALPSRRVSVHYKDEAPTFLSACCVSYHQSQIGFNILMTYEPNTINGKVSKHKVAPSKLLQPKNMTSHNFDFA